MKLLIAGSDEIWSLEKYYVQHLRAAGVDLRVIPVQSMFYRYYNGSLLHKILYKMGLSRIGRVIEAQVRTVVDTWQPDVLWVFKGMELSPALLDWVRGKGVRLVNYNPDNPFLFSGKGSGNRNIMRSIGHYDLHFSYDQRILERIGAEYKIPAKLLPFGFELDERLYSACCAQKEVIRLCFLGNPDAYRTAFIRQLAKELPIDLYGVGWEKWIAEKHVTCYPPVFGDEFWKVLRRYRVQLNLMRPHNPDSHNMRSFEIPGVGGIGLFPRTPDHVRFFEDGKEVFLYEGAADCIARASLLLQMPEEDAARIRSSAREKSLRAGYAYRERALQALAEMKKLTVSTTGTFHGDK